MKGSELEESVRLAMALQRETDARTCEEMAARLESHGSYDPYNQDGARVEVLREAAVQIREQDK